MEARSAGSSPVGAVHPLSLQYLSEAGFSTVGLCSQSWDEHEAWWPDVVITVCDQAAGEPCPAWFGRALKIHWGLSDPSRLEGDEDEVAAAFRNTISLLHSRIEKLLQAQAETLNSEALAALMSKLGDQ